MLQLGPYGKLWAGGGGLLCMWWLKWCLRDIHDNYTGQAGQIRNSSGESSAALSVQCSGCLESCPTRLKYYIIPQHSGKWKSPRCETSLSWTPGLLSNGVLLVVNIQWPEGCEFLSQVCQRATRNYSATWLTFMFLQIKHHRFTNVVNNVSNLNFMWAFSLWCMKCMDTFLQVPILLHIHRKFGAPSKLHFTHTCGVFVLFFLSVAWREYLFVSKMTEPVSQERPSEMYAESIRSALRK